VIEGNTMVVDHAGDAVVTASRAVASEVVVRDIVNSYDRYEELSGVSFTAPAGKVTVLMGGSRSGKTLIVRHLLGQLRPDRGQILIDGRSVWEIDDEQRRELRQRIGVLRGGYTIHESESQPRLTVVENLELRLRGAGRPGDLASQVRECLRDFDLEAAAQKPPRDLHPSQRRRLAVALALIGGAPLVVIDDPGPGIDVTHLSQMIGAIRRWQAISGATLLITTHSLSLAKSIADHVVVLDQGRVIADGDPANLLGDLEDGRGFEGRFHTRLSVREGDPDRLRRDAEESSLLSYLGRGLAQQGQVLLFLALVLLFMLLLTGVIPLLPQPLGS
jgi:phospholipid/cholesterol/gamma-HCH transport system ATP-binding protein